MTDFNYKSLLEMFENASVSKYGISYFSRKYETETLSYQEIFQTSACMADSLRIAGVKTNDKISIVAGSSFGQIQSIFAVMLAGAIPCCLPTPRLGNFVDYNEALKKFLLKSDSSFAIAEKKHFSVLREASASVGLKKTFSIDELNSTEMFITNRNLSDPAILQFSSGTTRFPKAVVLSHQNILENCKAIVLKFPGDLSSHSGVSWLPLHHDMGLIGSLFTAIFAPGDITMIKPEDFAVRPLVWLVALSQKKATISPAPNFALELCNQKISEEDKEGLDLSKWSMALVGAEAVKEKTLMRFFENFSTTGFNYSAFTPVYGLAEATLAVSFSDIQNDCIKITVDPELAYQGTIKLNKNGKTLVSVGRPLGNVEIQLRNDEGNILDTKTIGRLWIRGLSVMLGYLEDGEINDATDKDAWFDTGDLAFLWEGNLFIYGRRKDIIIINGKNMDPGFIEQSIANVEGFSSERLAAVACENNYKGTESFHLFIEKNKGKIESLTIKAKKIFDLVIQNTGLIPYAVSIVETGNLPRTTSGKVKRQFTKKKYDDGDLKVLETCYG